MGRLTSSKQWKTTVYERGQHAMTEYFPTRKAAMAFAEKYNNLSIFKWRAEVSKLDRKEVMTNA